MDQRLDVFAVIAGSSRSRGSVSHSVPQWLAVFRPDVVETFVTTAALFLVSRWSLRRWGEPVMAGTVLALLLLAGANWLCLRELGSLLTTEALSVSWDWATDHPEIILPFLTRQTFGFLAAAALWSALPVLLVRRAQPPSRWWNGWRLVTPALCLLALAALISLPRTAVELKPNLNPALRGYWSSTLVSLLDLKRSDLLGVRAPGRDSLLAEIRKVTYPAGRPANLQPILPAPPVGFRPRHIVIVALETAPRRFYPIAGNPAFPAFYRLSRQAIVSDHHYGTRPYTTLALYSMLTGTYPPEAGSPARFGHVATDGLATILRRHGYETSFIDSYKIDWQPHERNAQLWTDLGFSRLRDASGRLGGPHPYRFGAEAERERASFHQALEAVLTAQRHRAKALVVIATALGHSPWKAAPEDEKLSGQAKLYAIARFFDRLTGELVDSLRTHGLDQDLLLLFTGDHGLRYGEEFHSLGEDLMDGDVAFNVPFLLYAPGLVRSTVHLPYLTSHVDITPTLLQLVGIGSDGLLLHGESMLDGRLAERASYLLNTGLSPLDRFCWRGQWFTVNHLAGDARPAAAVATASSPDPSLTDHLVDRANRVFDLTAVYFLHR